MNFSWMLGPLAVLALGLPATAADWPQWLGPNRNGVWSETGLISELPADGPTVLWRQPIGTGYAGPAVVGGKVFVMDRQAKPPAPDTPRGTLPGTERVLCLDAKTGQELWKHEYDCPYARISYPEGPRTTPVVADNRVYTLGTMGDLRCLDTATGKPVWTKNFVTESGEKPARAGQEKAPKSYNVLPPVWGYSSHLLLHGDLHHWNVLSAQREPWLAIDPKGVVGEPAYETAAWLRNPVGMLLNRDRPGEVLERRVSILSDELGFDRERIRKWGAVHGVLSAWWTYEDHGHPGEEALEVARLLAALGD